MVDLCMSSHEVVAVSLPFSPQSHPLAVDHPLKKVVMEFCYRHGNLDNHLLWRSPLTNVPASGLES